MIYSLYPGKSIQDAMAGAGAAYTGITPVFTASVTTGVAPLSVFVEGTGTTAINTPHAWRDCMFAFDSGDTSSGNYTYGTRAGQSKRKNVGGPTWGHVYETPGTYTMYGWVYDGIGYVQHPIATIVVQDPDVVFSGTNTICCSTSGNFTGAPSGSSNQTVANLAAALAFMAGGKRVLLQTADAWTCSTTYTLSGTKDNMVLGPFGGGRATITFSSAVNLLNVSSSNVSRVQVKGFEFNGASFAARIVQCNTTTTVVGVHLHDFHAYDIGGTFVSSGTNLTRNLTVSNALVERVKGGAGCVGIYAQAENILFVDGKVLDSTAAEFPIRIAYCNKGYIGGFECSSPAANKQALTIRPPLWAGGSVVGVPANSYTQYMVVADSKFSSNTAYIVTLTPQATNSDERIRFIIFERNYVSCEGAIAGNGLVISAFNCLSRNNIYNMTGGAAYCNGVYVILNSTFVADGNESWNDTVYSGSAHTEVNSFGATALAATNSRLKNALQYSPSATTTNVIGTSAAASTTGTNNSTNANAKTLNPLFNGTLTAIEGFALGPSSPYATFAVLDKNYSDALDKIRVSNGGAHMLASNATSAWTLVGSTP